jgi:two-component system, NarL family, sensor kinase
VAATPFITLTEPGVAASKADAGPSHVMLQWITTAVLVTVVVAVVGALAALRLAESESVDDARRRADLMAEAVLRPVLTDGLLRGDAASMSALDRVVRREILGHGVIRVTLWTSDGRVLYSDEPRLIGQQPGLSRAARAALERPGVRALVTDLDRPEHRLERERGKLLEAYRVIRTSPSGTPLLFETHSPYDEATRRATRMWRGFAALLVSSLLLLSALQVPVFMRLLRRIRAGQEQREALLRRVMDASQDERRRIAGVLHDGVVQDLTAVSLLLSSAADHARQERSDALAAQLWQTSGTVRGSIGALRSLLADIYPPSLASAGLAGALSDLAGPLRARGITVNQSLPSEPLGLDPDGERLVFRVAHECLVNAGKHAAAATVDVRVRRLADEVVLDIVDDGVGFDAAAVGTAPTEGHLGLRVMADLAREAGAMLAVSSAPGEGSRWQLRIRVGRTPDASKCTRVHLPLWRH